MQKDKPCWGGRRACAGRRKTCLNKVPFNRRINEDILNILKDYAQRHHLTETEALESAILLQSNLDKRKGNTNMKLAIPTTEGKLCAHFGHCETFTFVEINPETKEILEISTGIPEEGITCQSANWIAAKGVNVVLAGGMGGRPRSLFEQHGVEVVTGCPEAGIEELVKQYMDRTLVAGENSCGHDPHHACHGGHGQHHCGGH